MYPKPRKNNAFGQQKNICHKPKYNNYYIDASDCKTVVNVALFIKKVFLERDVHWKIITMAINEMCSACACLSEGDINEYYLKGLQKCHFFLSDLLNKTEWNYIISYLFDIVWYQTETEIFILKGLPIQYTKRRKCKNLCFSMRIFF